MPTKQWLSQLVTLVVVMGAVGVLPQGVSGQAGPDAVGQPGMPIPQQVALDDLVARTDGTARMSFDPSTGRPDNIFAGEVPLSGPSSGTTGEIARNFLRGNSGLFATGDRFVSDLVESASYVTGSGLRVSELTQFAAGVEVFNSAAKVAVDRDGRVVAVANSLRPGRSLGRVMPALTGAEAKAAAHASFGVPEPDATVPVPGEVSITRDRPAKLYAFPSLTSLRLSWAVLVEAGASTWLVLVDAADGSELFRHNLTADSGPEGRVFDEHPIGAAPSGQATRAFAGTLPAAPSTRNNWIGANVVNGSCTQCTNGNNVAAISVQDGSNSGLFTSAGESPPHFDDMFTNAYELTGNPDADSNAAVNNLFYLSNVAHGWFYSLGFTESARNFQSDNFGPNIGGESDPAFAMAQFGFDSCPSGTCRNNATFSTPPDGLAYGVMRMFVFTSPFFARRDGSFDGDVVIHEYGHGVSNRLIGNATGLTNHQGRSMGEGWSDYWAITRYNDPVAGEYVSGNAVIGSRTHSYEGHPNTYGDICAVYAGCEVHGDGEIWAAALWDLRTKYRTLMGAGPGTLASDQVIFDGIASTPINPSMLNARDAIIAAEIANPNSGVTVCDLWTVFAAHGFGYSAVSGGDTGPITEAFNRAPSCSGATKLGFIQQPSSGVVAVALPTQPVVAVQDASGNTISTDNGRPITLNHASGPGGGVCAQIPVNTVNGIATFSGCSMDTAGTHTLGATAATQYYYQVYAWSAAGSNAPGGFLVAKTQSTQPDAPAMQSASGQSSTSLKVTWRVRLAIWRASSGPLSGDALPTNNRYSPRALDHSTLLTSIALRITVTEGPTGRVPRWFSLIEIR